MWTGRWWRLTPHSGWTRQRPLDGAGLGVGGGTAAADLARGEGHCRTPVRVEAGPGAYAPAVRLVEVDPLRLGCRTPMTEDRVARPAASVVVVQLKGDGQFTPLVSGRPGLGHHRAAPPAVGVGVV